MFAVIAGPVEPRNLSGLHKLTLRNHVKIGDLKYHVFLYKLYSGNNIFKSFCSGNIIGENTVLTSAHCFLTNRKRFTRKLQNIRIVAGTLNMTLDKLAKKETQEWRYIDRFYSQKHYRFPAFSLAVLKVKRPWVFTAYINFIPYATLDQDFDGICSATAVRTTTSWAKDKVLFIEDMHMVPREECEVTLQRSCCLYYCTAYDEKNDLSAAETEGGGLVCHGTGDPAEVDERGVLVGVTSLINVNLPTLHNRVGLFSKWVTDSATRDLLDNRLLVITIILLSYWLHFCALFVT